MIPRAIGILQRICLDPLKSAVRVSSCRTSANFLHQFAKSGGSASDGEKLVSLIQQSGISGGLAKYSRKITWSLYLPTFMESLIGQDERQAWPAIKTINTGSMVHSLHCTGDILDLSLKAIR